MKHQLMQMAVTTLIVTLMATSAPALTMPQFLLPDNSQSESMFIHGVVVADFTGDGLPEFIQDVFAYPRRYSHFLNVTE